MAHNGSCRTGARERSVRQPWVSHVLLSAEGSQRGKIIVDDFLEIDFAKCEIL